MGPSLGMTTGVVRIGWHQTERLQSVIRTILSLVAPLETTVLFLIAVVITVLIIAQVCSAVWNLLFLKVKCVQCSMAVMRLC